MHARIIVLLGAACLCACARARPAPLPAVDGVESWLIVFPDAQRGIAASTDVPPFEAGDDDLVLAFALEHPLSSLLLEPGPLPLESPANSARAWPTSLRELRLEIGEWRDAEAGDLFERDRRVRLQPFAAERCQGAGGCVAYQNEGPLCVAPCTPPEPAAPEPPEPLRMLPCAEGWRVESSAFGSAYCVPPDLGCSERDAVRFLGDPACVGASCARWPSAPPAFGIFVDAAAAPGGDGRQATPFRSLGAALQLAGPGATIVLALGVHSLTSSTALSDVELLGACRSGTTLTSSLSALEVEIGSVRLSALTLRGGAEGLRVSAGARAVLDDVAIVAGSALELAAGAELDGRRVLLRGRTVAALVAGRLSLDQAQLSANLDQAAAGAHVTQGGRLQLKRVYVHSAGTGILVEHEADLAAEVLAIESAGEGLTNLSSASATIADAWIQAGPVGIKASSHPQPVQGSLRLERTTISCTGVGLHTVRKRAWVQDLLVLFAQSNGVYAGGGDGGPNRDQERGVTHLERIEIQRSSVGINAQFPAFELSDFSIEDAIAEGLSLTDLPRATIERGHILIRPGDVSGLQVSPYFNNNIQIRDLTVTGTTPSVVIGLHAAGVIGERWHLSVDARTALEITASGTVLRDFRLDHPEATNMRNTGIDVLYGLVAAGQPALDLRRFSISGPGDQAFWIEPSAQLQLEDGLISGHRVGVHLQQAASSRLQVESGVLYRGNDQDVLVDP